MSKQTSYSSPKIILGSELINKLETYIFFPNVSDNKNTEMADLHISHSIIREAMSVRTSDEVLSELNIDFVSLTHEAVRLKVVTMIATEIFR